VGQPLVSVMTITMPRQTTYMIGTGTALELELQGQRLVRTHSTAQHNILSQLLADMGTFVDSTASRQAASGMNCH